MKGVPDCAAATSQRLGRRGAAVGASPRLPRTAPVRARRTRLVSSRAESVTLLAGAALAAATLKLPGPLSVRVPLASRRVTTSPAFSAIDPPSASLLPGL